MEKYFEIRPFESFFDYNYVAAMAGMTETQLAQEMGFKSIGALIGESVFIDNPNWIASKLNEFCREKNLPLRISQKVPRRNYGSFDEKR